MDEQVIDDLYNRAVSKGYTKGKGEFVQLLHSDNEVFNDMYSYVKEKGYQKTPDDFSTLIGKKKVDTESPLANGSLASQKQDKVGFIGNLASSIDKSILKGGVGEPIKALGTFLEWGASKFTGGSGKAPISDALLNFGNSYNKIIDDLTPQDEEFKGTLTDQFGQAFGQVASLIATQGASLAIGAAGKTATALEMAKMASQAIPKATTAASAALKTVGTQMSSAASISAGLSMGQSEFERAKAAGATDEQAYNVFLKNLSVGSVLEAIPVMGFLKRFEKATVGGVTNYLKTKAVGGLVGGTEEMTTEIMQQLYSNQTAKDIYDVNQNLFEGVAESGGIGFGVGFLLNAMGANAKILRKQGKKAEADMVEKQVQEFETQVKNGGPSSYTLNGIPLQADIAIPLIEKMSGGDLAKANLEIINDPELKAKVQERIVTHSVKEQVRQGNPELNEPSLNAITDLELQLRKLEGNNTQTGKDKSAAIRTQIKGIQENQLQEEVAAEATPGLEEELRKEFNYDYYEKNLNSEFEWQRNYAKEFLADPKAYFENNIKQFKNALQREPDNQLNKDTLAFSEERLATWNKINNKYKTEQDAVQEQATGESVLRTEQPEVGLQQVVEGDQGLEVAPTGTQEVAPTQPQQTEIDKRQKQLEGVERMNPNAGFPLFNVGQSHNDGNNYIVSNATDNRTNPEAEGVTVISKVIEPAEVDANGKMTKAATVETAIFDSKEAAQKSLQENYDKYKGIAEENLKKAKDISPAAQEVSLKTQAPKFVRDISALITPATVRGFSPLTERIKKLSLNYDKLVKQYAKKKDPKVLAKIKTAEAQILNDTKQEIIDAVAKVDGVAVQFKDTKRGLWDKKFEPSFNMTLSVSPQADTKKLSDLLFDFAEKYSQDAFILETESELHDEWVDGKINTPLSEKDSNGLTNYPQIIYTFAEPITDEQVADLSVELENNGISAFNINNNDFQVSVIFTKDQDTNLTKDEQYEERKRDYKSRLESTENAVFSVFGSDGNGSLDIRIKKSSYQGATNEGTADQTRQYDRGDILKAFQESTTKVEILAVELSELRKKEIDLQKEGKKLSPEDQTRFNDLIKKVQPVVQRTFEANKKLYEDAKTEVEGIAQDAISKVDASISPFPIKRAERASVKAIRWYNAFTEKLGDGSRVNIVVDTDANADKVFKIIDEKYPGDTEVRRITETTDLGYPKRLIEIRTSNGTLAEIQVITNEAYLAKDGIKGFTGDEKQKATAKQKLDAVRVRLGWNIPDGLGHYFYEIQRDTNVDDTLRDEAARLSDLYYDGFTNPKSTLTESFMNDVEAFKNNVDAADKSQWDVGNNGKAPQSLIDYTPTTAAVTTEVEAEQFEPITISDVVTQAFTKDNALTYDEDERQGDNGRSYSYLSSITIEATDQDENVIGTITKVTDEDKIFFFTVEDIDGSEVSLDGFNTLGEAKKALADSYNKIKQKEFNKEAKKQAKVAEKAAEKTAKKEAKKIAATVDDLLALDPNDKTTLKKISNSLDQVIKDINKFEKENLGVNIALPVIKTIIKAIKVLVDAGVSLQEAIKRVSADNNVNPKDVVDGMNAVSQIAPIQKEYDALMGKVDDLIARQKSRNIDNAKIVRNVDTYIRNSEAYDNANDAQKKIMEREGRNKMQAPIRRAVSMGRVLGALKDITNISRQEKLQVIKQIRDLSRNAAQDLATEIKELGKSGKITPNQAANVVARFGKVNMLNEVSVSNFVDYMSKVFADAEYAGKIEQAKSRLKIAKKNIATKIGIADGLNLSLQRLFSVNPTIIPETSLDKYLELVNMFGQRQAVLSLEEKSTVTKDVDSILNALNEEQSKANELAERFNYFEGKIFDDEGNLKYAETIDKMVEEKVIDEKEAEIMRKYKSDIAPQVGKTKMTEEELAEEKAELLNILSKTDVQTSGLPTSDERKLANRLKSLISTNAVKELNNTDLKNLLKVLDNIDNNYLPHYAQLMVEKLNAINYANSLTYAIKKAVIAPLSGLYSRIKSSLTKRGAIEEMIRRNPLFNIDQLFGNYKTKDIFNAILSKAAEGEANFKAELKKVQNILEKAEEKIAKSFKLDPNKTTMSKFKMMTYMVQLENDSNQGSKQVNPASEYLKATIKHIDEGKSAFGERDAIMLQEILDKYGVVTGKDANGKDIVNIDNKKLYNSFNQAEKDAIKDIRNLNESLREKAEYTAAIIRGDRINPLTNYVHLNVLQDNQPNDLTAGTSFITEYNNSMRPSTKAKSLIARTGKVSPLNFDIFASAQRGAKFVLLDYNLTEPIRTARKTINQTIANFEKDGRIPKEKRQIINAINSAFEETTDNLLTNSFLTTSVADDFVDYINKQGYRAVLSGTSRFVSELSSNVGFAVISDPKAFITGVQNKGFIMSADAPLVMENVNSKQTNRIFPTDTLSGKLIDTNILQQASGIKGAKSKNPVKNKIQQIWNLSGKKYTNSVELVADALISTPDRIIMRPMWFGSFANEFKNITGENINLEKIAANDAKYMEQYKDAIEKSKTTADERSVMIGATDNSFMGVLKGTIRPDQSFAIKAFNNFNNFMTKFLIFEFVTARTAINAAMGNGSLTKKQGAAVLGAVATRMITYGLITQMMGTGLMGLLFDDQEPEDEKSFMQKLGQQMTSAFTSLLFGRDFGNATKAMVNYGLERINENYLDFLREGEYDPYKDAIQYSIVPPDKKGKDRDLWDIIQNMGGAFGPSLKTADFIVRKVLEDEKKKADAIERREKEINIRIPLEILGNAGLIPLYKDIRKAVMKEIYSSLEKADKNAEDKKRIKLEKLGIYNNETDMKRYDPELWDETFGPNAPEYSAEQAKKNLKKMKDSLEKAMKDEIYNYTPKSKGGFGSSGFGGTQSKSKGGFGTSKFGKN